MTCSHRQPVWLHSSPNGIANPCPKMDAFMCEAMMESQNYPRLSRQPRPTVPHAVFAASEVGATYLRNILKNSYFH